MEAATANDIKKLVNEKISNRLRHGDTVSGAEKVDPPNDNPRVEPGMVNWHSDFDSAMAASQRSGKPVLLFHLLGQLDQQFT